MFCDMDENDLARAREIKYVHEKLDTLGPDLRPDEVRRVISASLLCTYIAAHRRYVFSRAEFQGRENQLLRIRIGAPWEYQIFYDRAQRCYARRYGHQVPIFVNTEPGMVAAAASQELRPGESGVIGDVGGATGDTARVVLDKVCTLDVPEADMIKRQMCFSALQQESSIHDMALKFLRENSDQLAGREDQMSNEIRRALETLVKHNLHHNPCKLRETIESGKATTNISKRARSFVATRVEQLWNDDCTKIVGQILAMVERSALDGQQPTVFLCGGGCNNQQIEDRLRSEGCSVTKQMDGERLHM